MNVFYNRANAVARDSKCYNDVEIYKDYPTYTAEFSLSSYGWNNVDESRKRFAIPLKITKGTDLSTFKNVTGLVKVLGRLKEECDKGVILEVTGSVLVYPTRYKNKYYISVVYFSVKHAF